jgi:hypothetical protein
MNKRRSIKRRLIFRITMTSLFSPMGRNLVKKGSWVSRYTRIPKIKRVKPEKMSTDLNFFIRPITSLIATSVLSAINRLPQYNPIL